MNTATVTSPETLTFTKSVELKFAASDRHWRSYLANGFEPEECVLSATLIAQAIAEIKGARERLAYAVGETSDASNFRVAVAISDVAYHRLCMRQGSPTLADMVREILAKDGPSW